MDKNNNFDERQLWIRGEAFKHGLLFMGFLLLLDAFLKSDIVTPEGINLVEGMWGNILIIVLTTTLCEIELILRGALDFDNRINRITMYVFAGLGAFLFIWGGTELLLSRDSLLAGKSLSGDGAELLMAICWLIWGIVGIMKIKTMKYED